jgi:predicted transcriptional regulator
MRVFWATGAMTVRELCEKLITEPLAYTTLMSLCVRLYEKGLLDRRKLSDAASDRGTPYIYTPATSEAEYTRAILWRSFE